MNTREGDERTNATTHEHTEPGIYEIRVNGHLDARWSAWFDGLDLSRDTDGTTAITGPIADQAALHGVLQKVRDLGLELISVNRNPGTQAS
jgi:hypothetical protein